MRRSKSDPSKYARNYKSISQRRMTEYENIDEEKEMERLRIIIQTSQANVESANEHSNTMGKKRMRNFKSSQEDGHVENDKEDLSNSILSEEMKEELGQYGGGDNPLVLLPKKKKAKTTRAPELTPQEIRQAKQLQKNTSRKLKQLAERAEQKQRRAGLYDKLKEHAISSEELNLLSSSSTLGKRETKRETLKRLLQRERAGITLTEEDKGLLYQERDVKEISVPPSQRPSIIPPSKHNETLESEAAPKTASEKNASGKKKKTKRNVTKEDEESEKSTASSIATGVDRSESSKPKEGDNACEMEIDAKVPVQNDNETSSNQQAIEDQNSTDPTKSTANPVNFAAQMMASLTNLKSKSAIQTQQNSDKVEMETRKAELKRQEEEEREQRERPRYVPTNPAILKTAATIGLEQTIMNGSSRKVCKIDRPAEVQEKRYELPVSAMEFEIVDSIRNNDVTIICGETGSGKSTQVPQFLYEAGFNFIEDGKEGSLLVGVTQPRRVAAVSTAKRVCYEMGQGDGQSIKNGPSRRGNLVAYQTRYETAGLGSDTKVKFMTDGILLQEIQSDLLLRKYGAIILDEAHERNLNTDVLLGLLSVAVPLRRQASEEEGSGIVPLKVIIMSATLRVEDFTENKTLFPTVTPSLVTVPGRTHPVTIHHSKVTELDDYETAAFNKICKIHRKLPKGGILVFLTGKQEIVRMVKKLRRALGSKRSSKATFSSLGDGDVVAENGNEEDGAPRDMDDDEMDGDYFDNDKHDDFDDMDDESENDDVEGGAPSSSRDPDENIPKHAHILPLYSMLSAEEQATVFAPVAEGQRLIIVATNIAETSITIPGISYVVDTGRQKCRNHHAGTGVASFDIMWISKAAADQRAGRAGRTGPGHCYRMYSSSMYSRHMNDFALPEVLTRPLEDVVLAMKAMSITNVAKFPFPTAPDRSQLDAAVKLLANIGCVDLSTVEDKGGDGDITRLGRVVAKLPLGVRYGKMLLVAAQAGVLDYAIVMVAVLSESSPFLHGSVEPNDHEGGKQNEQDESSLDEVDRNAADKLKQEQRKARNKKWMHTGGDILAAMLAVGAYTFAGRGAGGAAENVACRNFCEEHGLNFVVMERIRKMRMHLARLAMSKFTNAKGVAAKTGGILSTMPPPNALQENLLKQAIASGLLDHVAILAPPGSITGDHPFSLRSAYLSCSSSIAEPIFVDRNSALFSSDSRQLPQWVCYDSIVRKKTKDGASITVMKNITPIDPAWLGVLANGSHMLTLGSPLVSPLPSYDAEKDVVLCSVSTKFGSRSWEIPPLQVEMFGALQSPEAKHTGNFMLDDSFRWFARFLLEGKVITELKSLNDLWNDNPSVITRKTPVKKVALFVSALSSAGVDSAAALCKYWAETDNKFLFKELKYWTKPEHSVEVRKVWVDAVKKHIQQWKARKQTLDKEVRHT